MKTQYHALLMAFSALLSGSVLAQETSLESRILKLDAALFDAFNARDISRFKDYLHEDLEFYHDKSGKTGKAKTLASLMDLAKQGGDLTRTLVEDSVEVYPVPDYGAIQTGLHTFCHTERGKADCGTFKFLHLWQKTDAGWQITRVMSYDH